MNQSVVLSKLLYIYKKKHFWNLKVAIFTLPPGSYKGDLHLNFVLKLNLLAPRG